MFDVTAQGDHPKDFVIRSDNSEGEIDKIKALLAEAGSTAEDPLHQFFHGRPVEDFQQGVVLPATHAVDLADLTEGEPELGPLNECLDEQRQDAEAEAEKTAAAGQGGADAPDAPDAGVGSGAPSNEGSSPDVSGDPQD